MGVAWVEGSDVETRKIIMVGNFGGARSPSLSKLKANAQAEQIVASTAY